MPRTWVLQVAIIRLIVPLYCLTLFCSSALLFSAEPMFARMILPLLGGTPAVWNTCLVGFQILLLAAYAYGHWSIRYLGVRRQAVLHVLVLLSVAVALPIMVPRGWQPPNGHSPILWLLMVLPVGLGLPFFAVAGTAPVLQRWFSASGHPDAKDPYFLYAASNVGSLAALLAYPSIIEPLVRVANQTHLWSAGYVALIALTCCCAVFIGPDREIRRTVPVERITAGRRIRWIVLAMVPSSLLLGSTTFITTDIAAVPLLWIVPLAIYLLSFTLAFRSRPMIPHAIMTQLQPVAVLSVALIVAGRVAQPVWIVLAMHLAALFISSMVCHGELAADRPLVGRLTDFYLTMSLGGVLGGLFNAMLAPLIFRSAVEYPIALVAACALCPLIASTKTPSRKFIPAWLDPTLDVVVPLLVLGLAFWLPRTLAAIVRHDSINLRIFALGAATTLAATAVRRRWRFVCSLAALFCIAVSGPAGGTVLTTQRSFFGIHRVLANPAGPFNDLYHGTTVHGRQKVDPTTGAPIDPTVALTYYHRTGPIGQLLSMRSAAGQADRIGVVGMGVASLAAYADRGTHLTYYEIDPVVRWMAEDSGYFSFLKSAQNRGADVRIIMGDARLTLRDSADGSYDVLVLDAFSGDAIPIHLLTREAMKIDLDKLADNGVLAIHISNIYLDLAPVVSSLVRDAGCIGLYQDDSTITRQQAADGKCASQWIIVARTDQALAAQLADPRWQPLSQIPPAPVWTDDFSNILGVFRWR